MSGARLRHYTDSFDEMTRLGIRIPIAWGHIPEATPADASQRASQQYWLGRFNAGYLSSLSTDGHTLNSALDCPGCEVDPATGNLVSWVRLPDGREVKTAIGEVSVAIGDWTDGNGRLWKDVLKHVALTPLPVMMGQEGFTALSTDLAEENGKVYFLSTLTPRRELSAAEEDEMFGKDDEETETPPPAPAETVPPPPPPEPPPPPPPVADAGGSGAEMAAAIAALESFGLHLPADTTLANLAERIRVAGHGKMKGKGTGAENEDEDEDEEDGKPDKDGAYTADGQTIEEERPVMMSLAAREDPEVQKLQAKLAAAEARETAARAKQLEEHKEKQLSTITELVSNELISPHEAEQFRERLSNYTLSLTDEGEQVEKKLDYELSTLSRFLDHPRFTINKAKKQRRPDADPEARTRKVQEEAGDELASRAMAPK